MEPSNKKCLSCKSIEKRQTDKKESAIFKLYYKEKNVII